MKELNNPTVPAGRLGWMDVLRGLLIMFVVIGHATGRYNGYIYQFHMGAFFFVSGYMSRQERRGVWESIYHRAMTTLLPVCTAVILLLGVTALLNLAQIYGLFFGEELPYMGIQFTLKEFLLRGSIYVWWLGAAWFILVLFSAATLNRILLKICGDQYNIGYIILVCGSFLLGYWAIQEQLIRWNFDLVLIAAFYYGIGSLARSKHWVWQKITEKSFLCGSMLVVCTLIMVKVVPQFQWTMDYPSRRFNAPLIDAGIVLNGLCFTFFLSALLDKIKGINVGLRSLGRNTLPIVLFHFMWFELGFFILFLVGLAPLEAMQSFIPDDRSAYWPIFVVVGVTGSILLWKIILKNRILRILFGQEKSLYDNWYSMLKEIPFWRRLEQFTFRPDCAVNHMSYAIKKVKNQPLFYFMYSSMVILIMLPVWKQGIILNDELIAYQRRMSGLTHLIKANIEQELGQGRPLRIMAAFNSASSFLFENIYAARIVQCGILLLAVSSVAYFIYKLFGDKRFCAFFATILLAFFPITFEHAVPNAFIGLCFLPMIEMFFSLSLFCNYAEGNKSRLLPSILFMGIAMLGYEFMVTFLPLFPLVWIYKRKEKRTIFGIVGSFLPAGCIAVIFLVLLVIMQKISGGNYEGAKLGFTSLASSVEILWMLFRSAIPGYWLTNQKYQYLMAYYGDNGVSFVRTTAVIVVMLYVLWHILNKTFLKEKRYTLTSTNLESVFVVIVALAYAFIPASANSVSMIYQGTVTEDHFTSLPVSVYLYVFICFAICFLAWKLVCKFQTVWISVFMIAVISIVTIPIQLMNQVFSEEQYNNTNRLLVAEKIFETDAGRTLAYHTVWSDDLFVTKNALAVHEGYWNSVANKKGIESVSIFNSANGSRDDADFQIYESGHQEWTLTDGWEAVVFSPRRIFGERGVRLGEDTYLIGNFETHQTDSGLYYYHFVKSDGKLLFSSKTPFENSVRSVGNTLDTCKVQDGYYADGWTAPVVNLTIYTGEQGVLHLDGYYNQPITGNEMITIFCNGEEAIVYTVESEMISFDIPCPPNESVEISIQSNFSFKAQAPDIRMLSFILSGLNSY